MKNIVPLFSLFNKQNLMILLTLLSCSYAFGQVKVGDNPQNIDPASLLELESADKAIVLSRITTSQMQAITPLQGAVIYNIEEQCVFYYNGSNWINLCKDANGFSIIDNGDNTYTVNDGTNPEFTFSTNTETITNITQNPDGTYTYTNEAGEETIIATTTTGTSTFSITDNGDNTYTFNDGTIPAFTLSANPETITNIIQNPNGTFTYTNEAGEETVIANGSGTGSLNITDNGDNTYTVNDGINPEFTITATPETITNIVQNANGTFTYTNEAGEETIIANGSGTGTGSLTITDNGDNTYTVNDGTNPEFTITATPETITNIAQNTDGTYTYINEAGDETIIASGALTISDNGDNTYTVNDGTNPAFTITTNPETVTNIVPNTDGTYTYTNEAGDETIIASNELTITDNGDNTYTVNDGTNPAFTITANPETVTNMVQNTDGSYTYTNEAGDETIIASSALTITDNGDNTYTVNDGTNPEFTITASPETITTITENTNGTYTYTNENGDETIISFNGTSEEGSVFFSDDANGFAENNDQFFWDNTNERLGIGTNTNLTDKLTLSGTMGISDGSEADPSYRFSADPDTGIFRSTDNELGFTVGGISNMKLTEIGLKLNNPLFDNPLLDNKPLMIRASQGELVGFQYDLGQNAYHINLRIPTASTKGGLNISESGVTDNRIFIENGGNIGINTNAPQSALHVVGNMRVTDLPPSQLGDTFVTVDEFGNFRKSADAQPLVTGGGRWTNSTEPLPFSNGSAIIPIFDAIDYNDGSTEFYESNSNILTIKSDGRYEIGATISLIGNVTVDGAPGNTWARISINGQVKGAFYVAANSGSTSATAFSSIHINDVLNLKANDTIRINLFSNANPATLLFPAPATSIFTIMKL